jgi:F0F1-type ATP synthase assembly protein I
MKFAGLGMELASYALGLAAVGYAIDFQRGHDKPYGAAAGTLLGFSFGMFRFIQRVSQAPK